MKRLLITLIRFYKYCLSPLIAPSCRFYPSCSSYAHQAIEQYGAGKGIGIAVYRFLKCHPFHPGGYDPVP
ncbi:MAG: membrane protein insertion efficiency factor YidD [Deltaproteobacteria bacterium]|nr:membrane protein insertion efficiency factor YidD [Deltaproteobacteria bacterium]MBI3754700.1 membrane protein insertion efficiency factor YidD [Deltaproteobacteria bacterium]